MTIKKEYTRHEILEMLEEARIHLNRDAIRRLAEPEISIEQAMEANRNFSYASPVSKFNKLDKENKKLKRSLTISMIFHFIEIIFIGILLWGTR